ncbi:hypothetical protein JYU34_010051 [Plutella xylostella]|uniref:Uncharacterized protein n=1 Tax=Plutella xylostella TaxID=51655 RepID=A0ABQ7QHN7_PLUXY|nr:hypothetical protein JYU34_010051 [Plutella xylostella]
MGMHNHGGGGYEALYRYNRLKLALRQVPEDSAEYFLNTFKTHVPRYEALEEDVVLVRSDEGHYHLTTQEILDRLRSKNAALESEDFNWNDEVEAQELLDELDRRQLSKYEPESALIQPHGHSGEASRSVPVVSAPQQQKSHQASSSTSTSRQSQSSNPSGLSAPTHS